MSSEVVRVVAWRDPSPWKRLVQTAYHIDSTGVSMASPQRCEYCGLLCIRYDTVECKPLHGRCANAGRVWEYWRHDLPSWYRIYENRYVAAREEVAE